MTRTANAVAWDYFEMENSNHKVLDFCAYRKNHGMETCRYVLVPVIEEAHPVDPPPRPRRNHRNPLHEMIIHTALNLAVMGVTLFCTIGLLAIG